MDLGDEAPALVSTTWLAAHLRNPHVRIVDARWYLDGRKGVDAYRAGHLPGALHLDVDTDLSAQPGPQAPGRHPLPSPAAFADVLARAGVGSTTRVIAYDDEGGSRAARIWWMLRYYGHGLGSVLDGGIAKWQAEGRALETGAARVARAQPMELVALPRRVVDKSRLLEMLDDGHTVVIDARTPERYSGAIEPLDRRAGHIPGALNAPYGHNLTPAGTFRPRDELHAYFTKLGAVEGKRVVVYCGSGITACHSLLALHLAGFRDTYLYEGSWSDWSSDASLPIRTGIDPLRQPRGETPRALAFLPRTCVRGGAKTPEVGRAAQRLRGARKVRVGPKEPADVDARAAASTVARRLRIGRPPCSNLLRRWPSSARRGRAERSRPPCSSPRSRPPGARVPSATGPAASATPVTSGSRGGPCGRFAPTSAR